MLLNNIRVLQPVNLDFDSIQIVNDDPVSIYLIRNGIPIMVQEQSVGRKGIRVGDTLTLTGLKAIVSLNNIKIEK